MAEKKGEKKEDRKRGKRIGKNKMKSESMKQKIFTSASFICIISLFLNCKKTKVDIGCGCNTDSSTRHSYYDNFGGHQYDAWLLFVTTNNQNAWFISVWIPNLKLGGICKICNPDLHSIRALTDTSLQTIGIPVKFAGKLKNLCPGENWGLFTLPETFLTYITIDSLKKQ